MTSKELKESKLVELPFKDGVSVFMYFKNDPDEVYLIIRGQPEDEPGANLHIGFKKNTMLMIMSLLMEKFDVLTYDDLLKIIDTSDVKRID